MGIIAFTYIDFKWSPVSCDNGVWRQYIRSGTAVSSALLCWEPPDGRPAGAPVIKFFPYRFHQCPDDFYGGSLLSATNSTNWMWDGDRDLFVLPSSYAEILKPPSDFACVLFIVDFYLTQTAYIWIIQNICCLSFDLQKNLFVEVILPKSDLFWPFLYEHCFQN